MSVVTPKFRVSYPNVFKAKLNELSGKEEFSLNAIFEPGTDLKVLKEAAQAEIVKKWGADKDKWPKNLRTPFRPSEDLEKEGSLPAGHEKGSLFVRLKANRRPQVVDASVQPVLDEADFYSGCYARADVNAYAYDHKGNRGVAFGLNSVQKMAEGEALSGSARPAEQAFKAVETSGESSSASDLFS